MKTKSKSIVFVLLVLGLSSFSSLRAEIIDLTANLDCAQANKGLGTCFAGIIGTGTGTMTFDTETNLLSWNVSYSGISTTVTSAHFHGPALPSQNAGIQVDIGTQNPAVGNAVISPEQASDLLAGLWYINVHTTTFTLGEIRGQVNPAATNSDCDIQLNQVTYIDGNTVSASVFRFANLTPDPIATEIKIWLGVPGVPPISVTNVGADGDVVFPASTDIDSGPLPLFAVNAALPRGSYELSCRLLDPTTGELLAEDRNFFEIKTTYAIGDTGPAGGIVFHVTNGGLNGLEAAPVDLDSPTGTGGPWGCFNLLIPGANGTAVGTGLQNTSDMLAGCGSTGAILTDLYELNGFDDWFLPSKDELNLMYINIGQGSAVLGNVGGFADSSYWSSSQIDATEAWSQRFTSGSQNREFKSLGNRIRAVRAF